MDDVLILVSLGCYLQHALGWFAPECEGVTMRCKMDKEVLNGVEGCMLISLCSISLTFANVSIFFFFPHL